MLSITVAAVRYGQLCRILSDLASAFGGYSMFTAEDAGRAIAGQISVYQAPRPTLEDLVRWYSERWGDLRGREEGDDERWAEEVLRALDARLDSLA